MDNKFPPRGSGIEGRKEAAPSGRWLHPGQLDRDTWSWRPGDLMLGVWRDGDGQKPIGIRDDRHIATLAGSRAGKTRSVIIPNLCHYTGSALVLDPKGELAKHTAGIRRKMGHAVHVLDPFRITGLKSSSHNPLAELENDDPVLVAADASQLAEAVIIGNERDAHWTDSARNLVRGLTLHLLSTRSETPTLADIRTALNGDALALEETFQLMKRSQAYDGVVARTGSSFLGKLKLGEREFQGILSTAQEQTAPLDDMAGVTRHSDFRLGELKQKPMTIYLVLPGMRMGTHFRWLRIVIQQAIAAMEAVETQPGTLPVLFVLEEFASLGYMRSIETAAGFMAGFHMRLWTVLQDISQLKAQYPKSWEACGLCVVGDRTHLSFCHFCLEQL